jgi:hypothetical protein
MLTFQFTSKFHWCTLLNPDPEPDMKKNRPDPQHYFLSNEYKYNTSKIS